MSRAAIQDTLIADQRLIDLGLDIDSILVNYDGDQRPNDIVFLVIRYEAPDYVPIVDRFIGNITVWVHMWRKYSTDFVKIDKILDIIDDILVNMVHVTGLDGYTLTLAEKSGRSRDLRDDVYDTICKSASYRILSRQTETV
jgi:hypothetical protein